MKGSSGVTFAYLYFRSPQLLPPALCAFAGPAHASSRNPASALQCRAAWSAFHFPFLCSTSSHPPSLLQAASGKSSLAFPAGLEAFLHPVLPPFM